MFLSMPKCMLISLYLGKSKYIEKHYWEILSIGRNVPEFFLVFLYTDYLPNLNKEFQVASTYDANAECQIWSFCYNLFLT